MITFSPSGALPVYRWKRHDSGCSDPVDLPDDVLLSERVIGISGAKVPDAGLVAALKRTDRERSETCRRGFRDHFFPVKLLEL